MTMPGMGEWVIILLIVLVVFGAKKLPQLGDGVGKAIRNFKRGMESVDDDEVEVTETSHQISARPAGLSEPEPVRQEVSAA